MLALENVWFRNALRKQIRELDNTKEKLRQTKEELRHALETVIQKEEEVLSALGEVDRLTDVLTMAGIDEEMIESLEEEWLGRRQTIED